MELLINNKSVELFEDQEVVIQQNSPLVDFKLQGDKTYSFNVPNSDGMRNTIGNVGHIQKSEIKETITGTVRASGRTAIDGKIKIRKANDKSATLDIVATPAGMDAKWWNSAVSTLDLGGDTFLTEEKAVEIIAVSFDSVLTLINSTGGSFLPNSITLQELLLKKYQYKITFFDNGTPFYLKVFSAKLNQDKRDFDEWQYEAQADFDRIANETNYYFSTTKQISIKRTGLQAANLKINIEVVATAGIELYLYEISKFQATKYLSIYPGTRKNVIKNKPYFFPTIEAKYFYGEKVGSTIALNAKDLSGELFLNTETLRTKFPIVPCFLWRWIFEKIAEAMGLTIVESDWNVWKDISVCSFIDMAQQCPIIDLPFNIYQTAMKYADYMPFGFTVKDMFDEFGLLTGTTWDFDMVNKQLRLIQIDSIFDKSPQVIAAESLDLRDGINYEEVTRYKLNYSTIIEAEKAIAPAGYFDDMPILSEDFQLLSMKLLPVVPLKLLNYIISSQALTVGKSVFFDQKEQTPTARVFFYNAELERALPEMNNINMGRSHENGIYEKYWKRMLNQKKGRKLTAKGLINLAEFLKLDLFSIKYHRGVFFLINQKQIKLRNNRKIHDYDMEIEIIS